MEINLVRFTKDGSQKNTHLPGSVTVVGRRHDCDLRIPLTSVSRRHCQLNVNEGVLKIRDLDSRNGTYLNGEKVTEAPVKAGDWVKIGPLTFAVQIDGEPEDVSMPLTEADEPARKKKKEVAAEKIEQQASDSDRLEADDSAEPELAELEELGDIDIDSSGEIDELEPLD